MKSLSDFNVTEVAEEIEELEETKSRPHDPPAIMVMRRKSIRQFPNGQRVALYYVDKLKKFITIPYDDMEHAMAVTEGVFDHLNDIVTTGVGKRIMFEDGSSIKVEKQTAQVVLNVHSELNEENKKKVSEMAHKSKDHFKKVVDFAWKHKK